MHLTVIYLGSSSIKSLLKSRSLDGSRFQDGDDLAIRQSLKIAHLKQGGIYSIAYALTVMMPPFEDYDDAIEVLSQTFGTAVEKTAAIFAGYIYVTLQPIDESFTSILRKYKHCAFANYILAMYYDYENDTSQAELYINKSISLATFTKNIVFKLTFYSTDLTPEQQASLKKQLKNLVQIKNFELSGLAKTTEQLIKDYLDELIIGSKMTSPNWLHLKAKFKL